MALMRIVTVIGLMIALAVRFVGRGRWGGARSCGGGNLGPGSPSPRAPRGPLPAIGTAVWCQWRWPGARTRRLRLAGWPAAPARGEAGPAERAHVERGACRREQRHATRAGRASGQRRHADPLVTRQNLAGMDVQRRPVDRSHKPGNTSRISNTAPESTHSPSARDQAAVVATHQPHCRPLKSPRRPDTTLNPPRRDFRVHERPGVAWGRRGRAIDAAFGPRDREAEARQSSRRGWRLGTGALAAVRPGLARTRVSEGSRSCLQVRRFRSMRRGVDGHQRRCLGISRGARRATRAWSTRLTRPVRRRSSW
jgi:hypothetical protein